MSGPEQTKTSQPRRRVTLPSLQLLGLLLSEPGRDDWYALEISRTLKLGSGTVVQALYRLEHWGWLEARWEVAEDAFPQRRPRRRLYRLTSVGATEARALIEQRLPGRLGWSVP